jgi:adenylosuccinate lyase
MIVRYTRPEMGAIWSEQHKYECWLETELAASEALAELGEVPTEAAQGLRKHASFELNRIHEIEREVRHDVIAFTTAVAESMQQQGVGEYSRWLHYGLTSNDVVDTAQALQIRDASQLIAQGLSTLSDALKKLAFEHKHTVQIGRTHGMHAEPITFGLKAALWWDEFQRQQTRFASASEGMRVGKISGAVGTFAHIGPEAEEKICARLGLKAAPITSQVALHRVWIKLL